MKQGYLVVAWVFITGVFLWTGIDYLNRRADEQEAEKKRAADSQAKKELSDRLVALRVSIEQGIGIDELKQHRKDLVVCFEHHKDRLALIVTRFQRLDVLLEATLYFWNEQISRRGYAKTYLEDKDKTYTVIVGSPLTEVPPLLDMPEYKGWYPQTYCKKGLRAALVETEQILTTLR